MLNPLSISRRNFARMIGAGAAGAVARPMISIAAPSVSYLSGAFTPRSAETAGVVRLNSNENPYGPSPLAIKAMSDAFGLAWRYPDEHADLLIDTLARMNGVNRDQILLGDGSGEILKMCASAFTGSMTSSRPTFELAKPTRGPALKFVPGRGKIIVADPTFEAILNHAQVNGADVVKVPLTKTFAHDLPRMRAAAVEGLIYVCNPNNPTASITPKQEMREFVNSVSRSTMILVDEAYFHYADSPDYESVIPMIKDY